MALIKSALSVVLIMGGWSLSFTQPYSIFEGVLQYKIRKIDVEGNEVPFVWSSSREYHSKDKLVINTRETRFDGEDFDMILDSKKEVLFKVNHEHKTITRSADREIFEFTTLEFKKIGEEKVLGYNCDVFFLKYIDKLKTIKEIISVAPDTLACMYYISQDLKINNPKTLAKLQGYRNTKLLDGRFEGITMKVIQKHTNGESLLMEVVKLEEANVEEKVKFSSYTTQN
jgi:Domain of unknown function (DUF4412)